MMPYIIEPPDILNINAVRLVPRPPYRIAPQDSLGIQVVDALPKQPIAGIYTVDPDGTVNLGFTYGSVHLADLTTAEAQEVIRKHLKPRLKAGFAVTVVLAQPRIMQQIRGPHLVQPDGTISLGVYGNVYVDNLTVPEARQVIEHHMEQYLLNPELAVTVTGFNSKVYYVITELGGLGQQVTRIPIQGKSTVLDAIASVNGLNPVSAEHLIWVARPAPPGKCGDQILPVDWAGITQRGDPCTNYQLFSGDRLYVKAKQLVVLDNTLARVFAPIERIFGITLLGDSLARQLATPLNSTNGNGLGTGLR
jgi:polysaccharide export outer membrane protein